MSATQERRPNGNQGGEHEENRTGSTSHAGLPKPDAAELRIDFWDLHLAERFLSPGSPTDHVAARSEIYRRRALAMDAFPADERYGDPEHRVDPGDLEGTDDEFMDITHATTGRPIEWSAARAFQDVELARRVIAWHEMTGEPYALPETVGTSRTRFTSEPSYVNFSDDYFDAGEAERAVHGLDGHRRAPSVYCPSCTPDPALAYWALESIAPVKAGEITYRARYDVERIERDRAEARGTVDLAELVRRAEAQDLPMFDLIPRKGVTYLAGTTGTLKTFLAIHWAVLVALSDRRVVFAAGEGIDSFGRRLQAAAEHHGTTLDRLGKNLTVVETMPDFHRRDEAFQDVLAVMSRDVVS